MAPSTTITLLPTFQASQSAARQWLDRITGALPAGGRMPDASLEASRLARARILQQASVTMLAPVDRQARAASSLLR